MIRIPYHTQTPTVKGIIKLARKFREWLDCGMELMAPAVHIRRPLSLILHNNDGNSSETGCCGNSKSLFNDEQRMEKSMKHDPIKITKRKYHIYCKAY